MRVLLALIFTLFLTSSISAAEKEPRRWSHYDKITKDLHFLGEACIAPGYFVYLFTSTKEELYRCYLIRIKHKNPNILCIIDHELATVFFPFLRDIKDKYDGPKFTILSDSLKK